MMKHAHIRRVVGTMAAGAGLFCLALAPLSSLAEERLSGEEAEVRLDTVRSRIGSLTERLRQADSQRSAAESELRDAELSVGRVVKRLKEITGDLTEKQARLEVLRERRGKFADELAKQRQALAHHVRAAYVTGRQDFLKILLNQEDPSRLARTLVYYDYLSRARAQRIAAVRETLQEIGRIERTIGEQTRALQALQENQRQAWEELESQRELRQALLDRLRKEIAAGGKELATLKRNERRLEALLKGIREAMADIPSTLGEHMRFATLKGRLPWPTTGRISKAFGSTRSDGNLKWQGVWISGQPGEEVHAVSHGRVAFADWLRGFGLLLIIDHGEGYMSLYGHNDGLFKETGDWVDGGDVVAAIGAGGTGAESGLYFEIRRNGDPVNPSAWCRKIRRHTALVSP